MQSFHPDRDRAHPSRQKKEGRHQRETVLTDAPSPPPNENQDRDGQGTRDILAENRARKESERQRIPTPRMGRAAMRNRAARRRVQLEGREAEPG